MSFWSKFKEDWSWKKELISFAKIVGGISIICYLIGIVLLEYFKWKSGVI